MKPVKKLPADFVFRLQNDWPKGSHHIVQGDRNHCGDRIAPQDECETQAEERFQPEERRETNEHPNRHPARQCMRGVPQIQKLFAERAEIIEQFFEHN